MPTPRAKRYFGDWQASRPSHGTSISPKYFKKGDTLVMGNGMAIVNSVSRGRNGKQRIGIVSIGGGAAKGMGVDGLRLYDRRTK